MIHFDRKQNYTTGFNPNVNDTIVNKIIKVKYIDQPLRLNFKH